MGDKTVLVSVAHMMRKFVPTPTDEPEPTHGPFFSINFTALPDIGAGPFNKCRSLMDDINNSGLTPGFTFVAIPSKLLDSTETTDHRDGAAMYFIDDAPSHTEQAKWSAIELSVEVTPDSIEDDPFDESELNYEPSSERGEYSLDRLQSYATRIFDEQQRTHHFSVIFFGSMARIVRWDRSGIVVTQKFNYKEDSALLGRFLWRFARLCPEERGHDLTALPVLVNSREYWLMVRRGEEQRKLKSGVPIGEHARRLFKSSLDENSTWWKLKIGERHFLVGAPHFIDSCLAGRATRGYIAINLEDKNGPFVYLKDCWRLAHDHVEREGDTLKYLNDAKTGKVTNIPTLVCHDDIEDQRTRTQDVWKEQRSSLAVQCPMKTYRHYRMVVEEVCLPMDDFRTGRELVGMLIMCILAHHGAYKKGILHRDISEGNVLIFPRETIGSDGKVTVSRIGILADWELSKRIDDPYIPRQLGLTGTWQFQSAHVLSNLQKDVLLEDEMESWLHLLLYFALRYLPHNCNDVGSFIHNYFDSYTEYNGEHFCGGKKYGAVITGAIHVPGKGLLKFFRSPPPPPPPPPRPVVTLHPYAVGPNDNATSSTTFAQDHSVSPTRQIQACKAVAFQDDPASAHPINMIIQDLMAAVHARYVLLKEEEEATLTPEQHGGSVNTPLQPRAVEAPVNEESREPDNEIAQEPDEVLDFLMNVIKIPVEWKSGPPVRDAPIKLPAQDRLKYERLAQKLQTHEAVIGMFWQCYGNRHLWPRGDKQDDQILPWYRLDEEVPMSSPPLCTVKRRCKSE